MSQELNAVLARINQIKIDAESARCDLVKLYLSQKPAICENMKTAISKWVDVQQGITVTSECIDNMIEGVKA